MQRRSPPAATMATVDGGGGGRRKTRNTYFLTFKTIFKLPITKEMCITAIYNVFDNKEHATTSCRHGHGGRWRWWSPEK